MPALSVLLATRNRREELLRALASVREQDVDDMELIVLDDASTDGTADAVSELFPEARVVRSGERMGYLRQRNLGAREARAPIFALIDDDCELDAPHTLAMGLEAFDHPRVGAVVLPLMDHDSDKPVVRNRAPDPDHRYVTDTYAGAASLLRRDAFLGLGGYRTEANRGEDSDHARRMLQSGLVVRLTCAPHVNHFVSTNRAREDDVFWQARTQLLATTWSLPWRTLPRRVALSLAHGARHRQPRAAVRGIASGAAESWRRRDERNPLPPALARALRRMESERLRRRYSMRLEELEGDLPPLPAAGFSATTGR